MRIIQRNRAIIQWGVTALWLVGIFIAISSEMVPLLYLLPVLGLLSFLLTDYFSTFVIAILLTVIVKTIYPDQMSGTTRALLTDTIWIAAIVSIGIKLVKPFTTDKEVSETINYRLDELPINIKHDLQTPIRMILGFCNAILRTDQNRGQSIPLLYRDNVQAIYRNAQQLEKMMGELLNRPKPVPHTEEFEPAILIKETVAVIQELMTAHRITLDVKIDNPLPRLALQRIAIRQVLLNVLKSMALANSAPEIETHVSIEAKVRQSALHITFAALNTIIQRAMVDPNWNLNEHLLKSMGGHLSVETITDTYGNIVVALLLPTMPAGLKDTLVNHRVLVVSEESSVIDLFKEYLSQYEVIGVKDINTFNLSPAQEQPTAVILTREQDLQKIGQWTGNQTPIIVCTIATAEEQLQQLNAIYLPKPVDYDTLLGVLSDTKPPVTHVLIVDDNRDSAEMLSQMLLAMSPTFVTWKSRLASEALILLDQHPIDAIILDVFLPDMDGAALAQLIRSDQRFADVPIVLVSAHQNLDFMRPVLASDRVSVFQSGGFDSDRFATYVEVLINAIA